MGKLQTTAEEVKILQADLESMKPALEEAAKEANEMIVQIAADTVPPLQQSIILITL